MSRVLVLVRRGRHQPLADVPARAGAGEVEAIDDADPLDDAPAVPDDDHEEDGRAEDGGEEPDGDLDEEPLARTLVFLVLGFVVMVAGLASVIAG